MYLFLVFHTACDNQTILACVYATLALYVFITTMSTYQHLGWYLKLGQLARDIRRDCLVAKINSLSSSKEKDGAFDEWTEQKLEEDILKWGYLSGRGHDGEEKGLS